MAQINESLIRRVFDEMLKCKSTLSKYTLIDEEEDEDVDYRIINYAAERFSCPLFVNIEFPERAGSLLQFMEEVRDLASLCYFNYAYSGERVGRALVGMEFDSDKSRQFCLDQIMAMPGSDNGCIRAVREVSDETFLRLTGKKRA